jgi:hypothetical protein
MQRYTRQIASTQRCRTLITCSGYKYGNERYGPGHRLDQYQCFRRCSDRMPNRNLLPKGPSPLSFPIVRIAQSRKNRRHRAEWQCPEPKCIRMAHNNDANRVTRKRGQPSAHQTSMFLFLFLFLFCTRAVAGLLR